MFKKLSNIGDSGIICDFGEEVNEKVNNEVIKLFRFIKQKSLDGTIQGIRDYTPSYNKLIISFDLKVTNFKSVFSFLNSIDFTKLEDSRKSKNWEIPICYDFSLDLENISKLLKISKNEIIKTHLETNFFVYMIGFIPGHPFMGDLNKRLFLNRLKTPRVKVPAGSVGIVEKFCNIYPYESPGGWNIIGRTPLRLFDKNNNDHPSLLSPGDSVKFKSISKEEFEKIENEK
jgi:KipI family sensor histidine kinase inhibitor